MNPIPRYYLSIDGSVEQAHRFYEAGFGASGVTRSTSPGVWPLHWISSLLKYNEVVFVRLFDAFFTDRYPLFNPDVNLVLVSENVTLLFYNAARAGFVEGNLRYDANGRRIATILDPFGYLWTIREEAAAEEVEEEEPTVEQEVEEEEPTVEQEEEGSADTVEQGAEEEEEESAGEEEEEEEEEPTVEQGEEEEEESADEQEEENDSDDDDPAHDGAPPPAPVA